MHDCVSEPELVVCSGIVLVLVLVMLVVMIVMLLVMLLEMMVGAYWKWVIRSCGFFKLGIAE